MSKILNKLNIFLDFPPNLMQNIKSFYISRFLNYGYCVLNDNKVYGLGEQIKWIFGSNESEEKYVLINELNDKKIIEFYQGNFCMFARNKENEIFSWGDNEYGQLAIGYKSQRGDYLKPENISFFNGKNIIEISCGNHHCLALSSDGRLYGWGENEYGQVGCGEGKQIISTPIEIDLKAKIKFIHCTRNMSFSVSFDGNSHYWGDIGESETLIYNPIRLKSSIKIKSILNTINNDICVLSYEGVIYRFSEENNKLTFKKICDLNNEMMGKGIIDICVDNNVVIFQTEDCVYVYNNSKVERISYKTLLEYFLFEEQITLKTVHIKENQLFVSVLSEILIGKHKKIYSNENSFMKNFRLNKFRVSKNLIQILESNVKYYYQSESYSYFALFVMNDYRVYCLGYNNYGKLGLGHNERVYEYTEITELKKENIQQFYEGSNCIFARNGNNEVFSWGENVNGQLGRGYLRAGEYLRPEKISYFEEKNILEISCGEYHCLAISSDGRVYGWGENIFGSVGCGEEKGKIILSPIEIDFKEKIKFIHCTWKLSFAVSFDGNLYYWGSFGSSEVIFTPKLIHMKSVLKVCCDFRVFYNSLFIILDKYGKVFEFNPKNEKINKIQCEVNFTDLYNQDYYYLFQSEECVYELNKRKLIKTNLNNIFDYYYQKSRYYKKTIEISKKGYLMEKQIQFNEKEKILILIDKLIFDGKYQSNFIEIKEKGRGGFGAVYEVEKKSNKVRYAIKMIEIQNEIILNEIKIMSELNNDFVVHYIDSWIESQMNSRKVKRYYLYIQMELYPMDLREFIDLMNTCYDNRFKIFNYFISCELFKELIECVNYLHSLNPSIIHRLLTPENILISDGINGRFLKLFNFELAKIHDDSYHTRRQGTFKYIAPEVRDSVIYNTKSDIYSLAMIGTEIFRLPDNIPIEKIRNYNTNKDLENFTQYFDTNLKQQCNHFVKIISNCLAQDYNERPNTKQLLEQINLIYVDKNISWHHEDMSILKSFYSQQIETYNSMIESTIKKYLETKEIQFYKIVLILEPTVKVLDKYYEYNFICIKKIGSGGYGEVYMAEKNYETFAIKQVEMKKDDPGVYLNEIKIMSALKNEFVVQYIDSWIELPMIFGKIKRYLFIQMELCEHSLRDLIEIMNKTFEENFKTFYYFISSELFKELIECLDYLHSLEPPIIHRDLKPENVLISNGINGRFLKLCDFGLAKIHQKSNHTSDTGTRKYMAPEVLNSRKYNTKSDIYSLALIGSEIFIFKEKVKYIRIHEKREDFDKYLSKYLNSILENHFKELLLTLSKCLLQKDYHLRPDCKQLLESMKEVTIDSILNDEKLIEFVSRFDKPENHILKKFFDTKLTKKQTI